jgi:hypothetical protein
MKYNQLSRYGAIAKTYPFGTGKVFFLVSSSEAAYNNFQENYPVDENGVVRVWTSWADVITAVQLVTDSSVVIVSPLFTTAPTLAQIDALNAAKVVVIQAGQNLPDGSYLATKAAYAINAATTTNLFQINGRIELLDLIGEIATTLGAATSGAKYVFTPTVGSTTDLCATTDVKNLATGGTLLITGTLANTLVATTQGAVVRQATPLILKAGILALNVTQTTTGNVKNRIRYKPLDPGAFVSPL